MNLHSYRNERKRWHQFLTKWNTASMVISRDGTQRHAHMQCLADGRSLTALLHFCVAVFPLSTVLLLLRVSVLLRPYSCFRTLSHSWCQYLSDTCLLFGCYRWRLSKTLYYLFLVLLNIIN